MDQPTYSNTNTPKKLKRTAFEPQNTSPEGQAPPVARGIQGNQCGVIPVELRVMCWNLFDFGSGFNSWTPLEEGSYRGDGEEFDDWLERQLELPSDKVGIGRNAVPYETPKQKIWSRWLRLADMARHIREVNADIIVLLEIMTRPKGGMQMAPNCWRRVIWHQAVCVAKGFQLPSYVLQSLDGYLKVVDQDLTPDLIVDYIQQEEKKDRCRTDAALKSWDQILKTKGQEALDFGARLGKSAKDQTIQELYRLVAEEESEWIAEVLTELQELAHSPSSPGDASGDGASSSTTSASYGLNLLQGLNQYFKLAYPKEAWNFISAQQDHGETVAVCVRKQWKMSAHPAVLSGSLQFRPLYSFTVTDGSHAVVVHAAHAPAPVHLGSKSGKDSTKWYRTNGQFVRTERINDEHSAMHVLCGDFNLHQANPKANQLQAEFFSDMLPPVEKHRDQLTSFKRAEKQKGRATKAIALEMGHMNAAYDKVLLVGDPPAGMAGVRMTVAETWKSAATGRRYSDHAWVLGEFVYIPQLQIGEDVEADWEGYCWTGGAVPSGSGKPASASSKTVMPISQPVFVDADTSDEESSAEPVPVKPARNVKPRPAKIDTSRSGPIQAPSAKPATVKKTGAAPLRQSARLRQRSNSSDNAPLANPPDTANQDSSNTVSTRRPYLARRCKEKPEKKPENRKPGKK